MLGSFTNVRPGSGAPSMAWHGDPGSLRRDGYSCDFGVGFLGAMQSVGAYVVRHSAHGPLCFLCDIVAAPPAGAAPGAAAAAGGALAVRPHELSARRLFFAPASLSVRAENARIELATFDEATRTVTLTLAPLAAAAAARGVARLVLSITSVHAGASNATVVALNGRPYTAAVSRGAFEVPLGAPGGGAGVAAPDRAEVQCSWAAK